MRFTPWAASRLALAAVVLAGGLTPVAAQDEARLRRIEAEIRALQRQVFPNSDGRFFTPEVTTSQGTPGTPQTIGTPSESAVTDILTRLASLESQLAELTARSEVNGNALTQLEARVAALETQQVVTPAALPGEGVLVASQPTPAPSPGRVTPSPTPAPAATPGPSAERLAQVRAILKPDSGDAGEDQYTYGFRLWDAGFYPEAQQALKTYVDTYPNHARISYGRNLLGRAYLDDGQARVAAPFFLENYQKEPNGARAADSLLYLAESMIALDDTPRACRALAEFSTKYPALATGRLQSQYDKDRRSITCP